MYMFATRLPGSRDLAYLVFTQWVPSIWILHRLVGSDLIEATLYFAIGYMAFISVYEVGYLANDKWDAKRHRNGRHRANFSTGFSYLAIFLAVRGIIWVSVGVASGWIFYWPWLLSYAVLAAGICQHNLLRSYALRTASFFGLAYLRFLVPVLGPLPREDLFLVVTICCLFYVYVRFLSHLDAKDFKDRSVRIFSDGDLLSACRVSIAGGEGPDNFGASYILSERVRHLRFDLTPQRESFVGRIRS
jgi:hypothetical protein